MPTTQQDDDDQAPAESGFKIIREGIETISQEKLFGEIFQRNLEENTDITCIEQEMEDQGVNPRDFPGICLKLGVSLLYSDKDVVEEVNALDSDVDYKDVFTEEQVEEIRGIVREELGA